MRVWGGLEIGSKVLQISLKLLPYSFLLFAFEDNELLSRIDLPP
jgi:hypothetical protein